MKLSKTEEELMNHLWGLKKAFMKDLLEEYPDPKPAATTISTLLKRMADKKFIAYEVKGNMRQYYPLVSKDSYFSSHINGLIKNFFNDSPGQFASFFTRKTDLTSEELEELKALIEKQIDQKK
ncbi:BlaI/MecI/CopY family transcriptional regulator [Algoriphagus sediminis]|uniref:BlaI/MecI/CopY family transcriptional regulator n=1 Tax=Algoriphagus sediminis TaxID=3057113 RepID=A0ABT7Y8Q5_9BACT|nr:BlaI/MecI/CopY family transcriptional regulator [Algoriphagus sediminis]MDN3202881.1 BlaI/MecI/CopY family transcriptional regulator [Algoriphagus sediminis]